MKIVVYGLSQIGQSLAGFFSEIFSDVIVIDENESALTELGSKIDVHTKLGNGASILTLETAEIEGADLFVAASISDEKNILSAHFAKSLFKVKYSVACLIDATFMTNNPQEALKNSGFEIDKLISPEKSIAQHVINNLQYEIFKNVYQCGALPLFFCVYQFKKDNPFLNQSLQAWRSSFKNISICPLIIKKQTVYERVELEKHIEENDLCFFCLEEGELSRFLMQHNAEKSHLSSVIVFGAGHIGFDVLKRIEQKKLTSNLKVVERDPIRASFINENLKSAIVLQGSATDIHLLKEAYIDESTYVLSLMNDDEANILAALLAKNFGTLNLRVLINTPSYFDILPSLGVHELINPREIIVSEILRIMPLGHVTILKVFGMYSWFLCMGYVQISSLVYEKGIGYIQENYPLKIAGFWRKDRWYAFEKDCHKGGIEKDDLLVFIIHKSAISNLSNLF